MAKVKATNIGISINTDWIELVQFGKDGRTVKSKKTPMPMATMDPNGDRLRDPETLATSIAAMCAEMGLKQSIKTVHVSVPGTLVRIVEMPKVNKNELVLALTSDAERYAIFNDTEAVVSYEILSEEPDDRLKILLVALRKDTVAEYKACFDIAKLKIASLEVETISSLRGFKYTGALDEVLSEVKDQPWGTIHFDPERIRIAVWHNDTVKNWREIILDTSDLRIMGEDAPVIQDLVEEVRRTIGMTRPVLWCTYGIPESLSTALTARLGTAVKPMLPGKDINLDDTKLSLASIGVAAKSYDKFPALIDIQPTAEMESSAGPASGAFKLMVITAIVLGVLMLLISIGLFAAGTGIDIFTKGVEDEVTKQTTQIQSLQTEVAELNKIVSINKELANRVNGIVQKNDTIFKVSEAMKDKIPGNVWLDSLKIGDNIELEGKSVDYKSVMSFSKNFDTQNSPVTALSFDSIQEVSEKGIPVYKFKMLGNPKL